METAARKIARLDRSIARTGQTITLERISADGATGAVTVALILPDCPAHVRASAPQDLEAPDIKESQVIISATQILSATSAGAPLLADDGSMLLADDGSPLLADAGSPPAVFGIPQRDDRVLIQGDPSNIQNVEPIYYGGELVRVKMLCRG